MKRAADILNGFSDCAFLLDDGRKVIAMNDAARALFGDTAEGRDFVHAMRNPEVLRIVDGVLGGQDKIQTVLTLASALTGAYRMTAARIAEGGAVVSFTDLSHVRHAEQMRSDFVANVSHELRSPLTALTGFIETLKGPARDDAKAQVRFLDMMEREAGRMNRLIADLLSLSRVEENARVLPTDEVDLVEVLKRVIATLSHQAEKDDVRIEFNTSVSDAPVQGEEDELTQVFHNLIENAVKYGGVSQTVTISMSGPDKAPGMQRLSWVVDVKDEGPGIAAVHLPRLTERFYRVDTGRSRDKGGTGLGLAIVKHIVQRHRGRLLVDATVGAGSKFSVVLPIKH